MTVPTEAVEALVQQAATAAVAVLAAGWPRVMEEERLRHAALTLLHVQRAGVAAEWNRRSRPVALMGAPGMGYGFNVLPFLRRSVEGRAMHATSEEIRGACRRTKWKQEVCWVKRVVLYAYCVCLVFSLCYVFVGLLLFGSGDQRGARSDRGISGF